MVEKELSSVGLSLSSERVCSLMEVSAAGVMAPSNLMECQSCRWDAWQEACSLFWGLAVSGRRRCGVRPCAHAAHWLSSEAPQ